MKKDSIQKLEAMAADTSSPMEAEIAQKRLDRLSKRVELRVPQMGRRPAKWLSALLIGVAAANNCSVFSRERTYYLEGTLMSTEIALEELNARLAVLADETSRLRTSASGKRQWRLTRIQKWYF